MRWQDLWQIAGLPRSVTRKAQYLPYVTEKKFESSFAAACGRKWTAALKASRTGSTFGETVTREAMERVTAQVYQDLRRLAAYHGKAIIVSLRAFAHVHQVYGDRGLAAHQFLGE